MKKVKGQFCQVCRIRVRIQTHFFLDSDPDPVISRMSDPESGKTQLDPDPRFCLLNVSVLLTIFLFRSKAPQ